MTPTTFPEANLIITPPDGIPESLVKPIAAFQGQFNGGGFDGATKTVVAWQPSPEERGRLIAGASVFVTFIGAIPVHHVSTVFMK